MQHHSFEGSDIPSAYGAYSHAVAAGDFVFVAGQTARDQVTGRVIDGDVRTQTLRALEIVGQILQQFGLTYRDVVRMTVYLADIADFEAMNEAYQTIVKEPFPARSTPQALLPFGAKVGIEATAYRPSVHKWEGGAGAASKPLPLK